MASAEESTISAMSLAAAIRSLDEALKTHLSTMDSMVGISPDSISKPLAAVLSSVANSQAPVPDPLSQNPRMKLRRNTRIPAGFDDSIATKIRAVQTQKVLVTVRVIFMKIGVIDTIHDRYSADVLVQSKWREPNFDNKKQVGDMIDWDVNWNPRISVENAIGDPKTSVSYSVMYDRESHATVCETRRVNGQFFEFMELNQFPFDNQDLTVTVVSEHEQDHLEFVVDQLEKCGINAQAFSAEQEWSLEQNVSTWKRTISKTVNKMTVEYPGLSVAAKASRRPQFFIWNIIVIMMAICSLAFATFTVGLETPQFRLQLTYILLLTTVTFKFVVNKSLPKISYLTYLDKYILGSMVILCFICIWHALIGSIIFTNLPKATPPSVVTATTVLPTQTSTTDVMDFLASDNSTDCNTTASPAVQQTSTSPGYICVLIDKIALAVLSFVYIAFHLFFVVLIWNSRRGEEDENNDDKSSKESEMSVINNVSTPPSANPRDQSGRPGIQISVDLHDNGTNHVSIDKTDSVEI